MIRLKVIVIVLMLPLLAQAQQWEVVEWNRGNQLLQTTVRNDTVFATAVFNGVYTFPSNDVGSLDVAFDIDTMQLRLGTFIEFAFRDPANGGMNPDYVVLDYITNVNNPGYLYRVDYNENSVVPVLSPSGDTVLIESTSRKNKRDRSLGFVGPNHRLYVPTEWADYASTSDYGKTYQPHVPLVTDSTCSAVAKVFPYKILGTSYHIVEVAGDEIVVRHVNGTVTRDTTLFVGTNPCNQSVAQAAVAISEAEIAIQTVSGFFVTADSGKSWNRVGVQNIWIHTVSSQFGMFIQLDDVDLRPLNVNFSTGETELVTATNGIITDTLFDIAVNENTIVGVGSHGYWKRNGPTTPWSLVPANKQDLHSIDACSANGKMYSLMVPYQVTVIDNGVPSELVVDPFMVSPVQSVSEKNGKVIVERAAYGIGGFIDHNSLIVREKDSTLRVDQDVLPSPLGTYSHRSFAVSPSGEIHVFRNSKLHRGGSNGFEVVDEFVAPLQSNRPWLQFIDDTMMCLIFNDTSFVGEAGANFFTSPPLAGVPKQKVNEFNFPPITSVNVRNNSVTLGYGIADTEVEYSGPMAVDTDWETGSANELHNGTSALFCLGVAKYDTASYASVVQRRTTSDIGTTLGPIYLQTWTPISQRWELAPSSTEIFKIDKNAAVTFDSNAVLYVAGRGLDSILVIYPPYESCSKVPMPPMHKHEWPTTIAFTDSLMYLGTNRNLYEAKRPTTSVEVVTPIWNRFGFSVSPNPATSEINVELYNALKIAPLEVGIVDLVGRNVADYTSLFDDNLDNYSVTSVPIENIASGVYLFYVNVKGTTKSRLLVVD